MNTNLTGEHSSYSRAGRHGYRPDLANADFQEPDQLPFVPPLPARRGGHWADRAGDAEADAGRFRAYFNTSVDCLFHVNVTRAGNFVYEMINPVGLAHAGTTLERVRGRTPVQVLGAEIGGVITEGLRQVRDTCRPYAYEPTFQFGSDTIVYEALYMPLLDSGGAVVGILGRATDITQRRRLEGSLRQAQKMEALGQLAGGVAHDFNNILAAMSSCLALLGRRALATEDLALLVEAQRTLERGAALTSRLLGFSRQQPLERSPVDFNRSLAEMAMLLGRTLGRNVRIAAHCAPELWPALADRNQVELAIMNLAINARDAMPEGGELTLTTRNATIASRQDSGLEVGDYVAIAMRNTGTGMSAEVLARALEPFFTTKPPSQGTGLGLSMVQGVVRQLGGGLDIVSQPGEGTCVTLYLPRAPQEATVGG
ncbi:two-component system sensor histidine kinase NtrB [Falsiroseomonas sp. E2-1-a20]|uniref:two-component system sensor histidine kinase NtrB n=1 Tax=Falsiroseomonas sp. E2-1-a20 TaxID=3239300 RepID=UPI003F3196FB